jgi:hypothetical protein
MTHRGLRPDASDKRPTPMNRLPGATGTSVAKRVSRAPPRDHLDCATDDAALGPSSLLLIADAHHIVAQ